MGAVWYFEDQRLSAICWGMIEGEVMSCLHDGHGHLGYHWGKKDAGLERSLVWCSRTLVMLLRSLWLKGLALTNYQIQILYGSLTSNWETVTFLSNYSCHQSPKFKTNKVPFKSRQNQWIIPFSPRTPPHSFSGFSGGHRKLQEGRGGEGDFLPWTSLRIQANSSTI